MSQILIPERLFQIPMVDRSGLLSRTWLYLLRDTVGGANAGLAALDEVAMWQGQAAGEPEAERPERSPEEPEFPERTRWPEDEFEAVLHQAPRAVLPDAGVLANIPQGLGTADAGREYRATDYRHRYIWSGTAWQFAEGDGSGQIVAGQPDGSAPNGGLWGLCDGSTYAVAQDDGSVANVTTQDLTGDVFVLGGAPDRRAATAPTWDNSVAPARTESATTGISVADHPTAADTTVGGAETRVTDGTHDVIEAGHVHELTDVNAKLNAPSEEAGGLPVRVALRWYIRR